MNLSAPYEFTADQVTDLLAEPDQRLAQRGLRAAVFVVGGAAIAAKHIRDDRLTAGIDVVSNDDVILEEATRSPPHEASPRTGSTSGARPWMPPLPNGVLTRPDHPGLRVTYADDSFLLATKLAQRTKDAEDIVALARRLSMQRASADELEAHIRHYYTDYTDPEALRASSSAPTTSTPRSATSPRTPPGCSRKRPTSPDATARAQAQVGGP